jgi:pimeloyl-ACP methyl ester carboxylesterase
MAKTSSKLPSTSKDPVSTAPLSVRKGRIGLIVGGSLAAGLAVGMGLIFAPFVAVDEKVFTGVLLLGFAVGWALLAVLSTRFTDQPQRWAMAPAVFMGLAGLTVLLGPDAFVRALGWLWPPALVALVVWMFTRVRQELHSRTRGLLLYPVLAALVVAAIGGGYERIGASIDVPLSAMPGQLVDVGQHRLHLQCTGSGGPTVVLEPGAGGMSSVMQAWIAPAVARETRVCVYDRAGRGWSDAAANSQDGAQIATDLHTLLHRAHVPGPYVLAGHSFGGLYVMSYAAQYPEDVAGMVLVDSAAPRSGEVSPRRAGTYDATARISGTVSSLTRVGLGRLLGGIGSSTVPARHESDMRASAVRASHVAGTVDEYVLAGRSSLAAGQLADLVRKPLIVLTADRGNAAGWMSKQDKMAKLSTNSLHRVVAGSVHESLVGDRQDAASVSRAIHDVVVSLRSSTPLDRG